MCALDGDTKEHSENWILSLDNVTMFLQKNQLNKSTFSNDIYIFLSGIVFFPGHPVVETQGVVIIAYIMVLLLLVYAFQDLWKEWGDSNFQIFSQNCQFHHRLLE